MSNPTHDPFYSSPFGPFYRRHSPYMVQPEYRIYEMNKRLQARTEVSRPGEPRRAAPNRAARSRPRYRREARLRREEGRDREARLGNVRPSVGRSGDADATPKCQTFLR